MGLHWWNKNLFGTQFGGSLYSMCDPHFVFILMKNLGPRYVVWDKAAQIEFLRPGRGRVTATFVVPPEKIAEIREAADRGEKVEPVLAADIVGDDGEVVARVTKRLWVRKKDASRT
jgi:acyl-coenzyme A thioesterase PaaI-like protein